MAKSTITYKCGCTEVKQLYGPMAERERKEAYYLTIDCPCCRAKAAKTEGAELTGSDRQIAWAADIRKKAQATAEEFMQRVPEEKKVFANEVVAKVFAQTSAAWWIDNRYDMDYMRSFVELAYKLYNEGSK